MIREVPRGDRLVVMMDANTRWRCGDTKVPGAYGRDTLNYNGQRLHGFAGDKEVSVANTSFSTSKGGVSHTFQQTHSRKNNIDLTTLEKQIRELCTMSQYAALTSKTQTTTSCTPSFHFATAFPPNDTKRQRQHLRTRHRRPRAAKDGGYRPE